MSDCCTRVTVFLHPLKQSDRLGSPRPRLRILAVRGVLVPRLFWGTYVKRTFISAAAVLAFAATAAHADELSDIQAQAKQLREQNQAMTKRLADLEKRQKALETKPVALIVNPVDSMAADLPYKAAVKARPPENDDLCWHGVCLYGNFDMGVTYEQHGTPFNALAGGPLNYMVEKASNGIVFRRWRQPDEHLVHRLERQAGDRGQSVRRLQLADPVQPGERQNANRLRRHCAEQRIGIQRTSPSIWRTRTAIRRRPARCSTTWPISVSVRRPTARSPWAARAR